MATDQASSERSKRAAWPLRICLAVLFAAYAFVFAEGFLRLFAPQPIIPRYVTATDYGVRGNTPGAAYRQHTEEVDIEIRINSQGLRADHDFALAKPAGVCRIALFGDSYFLGHEVDLEDTIAHHLERRLIDAGYAVEVLNFAVSGFGTAEMIVALDRDARRYEPDVAVFQWHASDGFDNVRANLFAPTDDGGVRANQATYLPGVATRDFLTQFAAYRWLIGNSHLYTAAREKLGIFLKDLMSRVRAASAPGGTALADTPAEASENVASPRSPHPRWVLSAKLLAEGQRVAHDMGAAWRVFEIPTFGARTRITRSLTMLPLRSEVKAASSTPIEKFLAHSDGKTKIYFEKGHKHLTPLGNRLAADVLADDLIDRHSAVFSRCAQNS